MTDQTPITSTFVITCACEVCHPSNQLVQENIAPMFSVYSIDCAWSSNIAMVGVGKYLVDQIHQACVNWLDR